MKAIKSPLFVIIMAAVTYALNGWINYSLAKPLPGVSKSMNLLRYHLDDGLFTLLFLFAGLGFIGFYTVLRKEKGYLYLACFAFLAALLQFSEWNGKPYLFGDFPDIPYFSLLVKSSIGFLNMLFVNHLLAAQNNIVNRVLAAMGGGLLVCVAAAAIIPSAESLFRIMNILFLGLVVMYMAWNGVQFISLLRKNKENPELQWLARGFVLFLLILIPDIGKDVLEYTAGRYFGYQYNYWEQCLEDTFPWALLELMLVFGLLFLRRFTHTLRQNREVTEQIKSKNKVLEQEVATRQSLDQLLTELTKAYRVEDLEQSMLREGNRYFKPYAFRWIRAGEGPLPAPIAETLQKMAAASVPPIIEPGAMLESSAMAASFAGRHKEDTIFLAVVTEEETLLQLHDRERFALQLMGKYVSVFLEYFHILEARMADWEARNPGDWMSKLFMQIAEKERKRLASDLHDEVLQELLHLRRQLEQWESAESGGKSLEKLRIGLENAEFMIRETCRELMPSFLSDRGVVHAIHQLVEKTRLRADFNLMYAPRPIQAQLTDDQMITVYRVVQELINNACKHSEADVVTLEVAERENQICIRYSDDGKGMALHRLEEAPEQLGLRGITERVRMLGGTVRFDSKPGEGMKAECVFSL